MTIVFHIRSHQVKPHFDESGVFHVCASMRNEWAREWKRYRAEGMHRSSESSCTVRRGR